VEDQITETTQVSIGRLVSRIGRRVFPARIWQSLRSIASDPVSVKTLLSRKIFTNRLVRNIERTRSERCWCGGELGKFKHHRGYGVCKVCGSYANRNRPTKEGLQKLYGFDLYWHAKQKADGFPAIEERSSQDLSDGRVEFCLDLVSKYAKKAGRVIEVGCAHGINLRKLSELGYECIGVEVDRDLAAWTAKETGLDIRSGIFPDIDLPTCDIFLSFDVLEHSSDPEAFMAKAARLLAPGGVAIIQTVIDRYQYEPPFGSVFPDAFDGLEHLFIFTDAAITEMARRCNLTVVSLSESIWLMGEVCVLKKE
jgi:SAM-dependent methyltransferase